MSEIRKSPDCQIANPCQNHVFLTAKYDFPTNVLFCTAFFLLAYVFYDAQDIAMAIVMLAGAIIYVRGCIDRRDILIIDEFGIFDRRNADISIPWSDIISIDRRSTRMLDGYFLIKVHKPEVFMRSPRNVLARISNNLFYGGRIPVGTHGLDVWPGSVEKALRSSPAGRVMR